MDDDFVLVDDGVSELVKQFLKAVESGNDAEVLAVHVIANASQDSYIEAWGLLGSRVRTAIKLALERAKNPYVDRYEVL